MQKVNILVCPYNYILSKKISESVEMNIKNAVIVFDEAHNIQKKAEDA